jgi:hypothetical protein
VRWAGHAVCTGKRRGAYRVLAGKTEGKRPLGRRGCRWEDNIKMGIQEIGCEGVKQIDLVQYRNKEMTLVNAVMNVLV